MDIHSQDRRSPGETLAAKRSAVVVEKCIRVLVVDDHTMFREGICSVLRGYSNIEVVGEASDGDEAIVRTGKLRPAVVLMDITMQKMDGITATRLIKKQYPRVAVLGVSVNAQSFYADAMLKAGASEVITKEKAVKELYAAIEKAMAAIQPHAPTESHPQA